MCNIYILVIKNVFNLFNINISFSRCVLSRHYFNKLLTFFFQHLFSFKTHISLLQHPLPHYSKMFFSCFIWSNFNSLTP